MFLIQFFRQLSIQKNNNSHNIMYFISDEILPEVKWLEVLSVPIFL